MAYKYESSSASAGSAYKGTFFAKNIEARPDDVFQYALLGQWRTSLGKALAGGAD